MKRTFLKVLPFAAALLLATSCSKDDNNSTDEIVNGGEQIETVAKTVQTLTIKGKVKQSISKVTTNSEGTALAFEANDVFTFGTESDDVCGTITIQNPNGDYEATVNYTSEEALFSQIGFTATLGSNPENISTAYADLATAVKNACYETVFTISYTNGKYSLASTGNSDIVINLKSAFIKALSAEETTLGGEEIKVVADKYYVVAEGKTMGNSGKNTLAGQIYSLGTEGLLNGVFSVSATKKVRFSKGNLQYHCKNKSWRFAPNQWDYIGDANKNISTTYDGFIDLFGWGTWLVGGNPTNSSNTDSEYTWDNSKSPAIGSGWSTLSDAEWFYLLGFGVDEKRTNAADKRKWMAVNNVNGLVILPDECSVSFTDSWEKLEAAGAVFLPAAGNRNCSSVNGAGTFGNYWSSSVGGAGYAWDVAVSSGDVSRINVHCYYGRSVRLVSGL